MNLTKLSRVVTGKFPYQDADLKDSTILIGSAIRGPGLIPIKAISPDRVAKVFGVESQLTNAYLEATLAGATNIFLIKVDGDPWSITLKSEIDLSPLIEIVSIDSCFGAVDFTCEINEFEGIKTLHVLEMISDTHSSFVLTGKTILELEQEINRKAYSSESKFYAITVKNESAENLSSPDSIGENWKPGVDNSGMGGTEAYRRIDIVLNYLESVPIFQIGMVSGNSIAPNEAEGYFYNRFAEFAGRKFNTFQPCTVTVGRSVNSFSSLYLQALDFSDNSQVMLISFRTVGETDIPLPEVPISDVFEVFRNQITIKDFVYHSEGNFIRLNSPVQDGEIFNIAYRRKSLYALNLSPYVNVVLSELLITGLDSSYISNGVASYCGVISSTPIGFSTTNSIVKSARHNLLELTDEELKNLSRIGFVVFTHGPNGNIHVYRGVNLFRYNRMLSQVSNILLIQDISYNLQGILEEMIGGTIEENELRIRVNNALKNYSKIIRSYSFEINKHSVRYVTDYVIKIEITPYGEVDNLSFAVSVW